MSFTEVVIGDLIMPISKWNPNKDSVRDPFNYVDLSSVDHETKTIRLNGKVAIDDAPSRARQVIEPGDVLVSTVRPNLNGVAVVPDDLEDAIGSTGFCVLRPNPKKLWNRYLFHWVKTQKFIAEMTKQATGQSYPAVSDKIVKNSLIYIPKDVKEQKRIAAILDQADALCQARRHAIIRLNDLSQSIFYEMFGNPMEKADTSLGDVLLSMGNGMSISQDETGNGVPITRIETIWNGEIDLKRVKWSSPDLKKADRYFLKPGDILFSHINSPEHIAKTAIYEGAPESLLHGINLLRLQPDHQKVKPLWLLTLLKAERVRAFFRDKCKKAVNQASLNQTDLKELHFFLPPIKQQSRFSERLFTVSQQIDLHEKSLEIAENLFLSLQQRAFSGEL